MSPKYNIQVALIGKNGNAWEVLGSVIAALKEADVSLEERTQYIKEALSGNYSHMLQVTMQWVEVVAADETDDDDSDDSVPPFDHENDGSENDNEPSFGFGGNKFGYESPYQNEDDHPENDRPEFDRGGMEDAPLGETGYNHPEMDRDESSDDEPTGLESNFEFEDEEW